MPKYQVELTDGRKIIVEADRQPTEAEILGRLGQEDQPAGAAALSQAEGISEQPWYSKNIGGLPSVTQALRALPMIGGVLGGVLGAPGVVSAAAVVENESVVVPPP